MHGLGVPLVTPFDDSGAIDETRLRNLVGWLEDGGVDFLVPCGSTSEAPLLTADERVRVVEIVTETTELPVVAGTGHEGYQETIETTARAADAGADAALVITPTYYGGDGDRLAAYYRDLADESPIPISLYSVPKFTGYTLSPETAAELATHENIAGIKDSSGSLESLHRLVAATDETEFSVLAGSTSVYAAGLDIGTDGAILAVANIAPDRASEVYRAHRDGHAMTARSNNGNLIDLNRAVTAQHGIPGVKAALSLRGQPVGPPRRPLRPIDDAAVDEIETAIEAFESTA